MVFSEVSFRPDSWYIATYFSIELTLYNIIVRNGLNKNVFSVSSYAANYVGGF